MSSAETMPYRITETVDLEQEEFQKKQGDVLDYKMVTLSLGGRDYGINIMKVKEIGKISRITYVPNTLPAVKGVYNLRGEIISIIDLRIMFNIPVEEKIAPQKTPREVKENLIILRLEEGILGVIVDSINKVVGVSSKTIQPPHPLFGDINIRYLSGIVESDERLYVILDVEEMFNQKDSPDTSSSLALPKKDQPTVTMEDDSETELTYGFIVESLSSLTQFFVTDVNREWVKNRVEIWKKKRSDAGQEVQLEEESDANDFLKGFFSSNTGVLWDESYRENFKSLLPVLSSGVVNAWNPGCSKGLETYSLATALKEKYPAKRIKIWAHDNNLLEISIAPTLVVHKDQIPPCYAPFLVETPAGHQFNSEIKDTIIFEYHDSTNENTLPPIDLILCRDLLSFLPPELQLGLAGEFDEHIRPGGLLILGENETLSSPLWQAVKAGNLRFFQNKSELQGGR